MRGENQKRNWMTIDKEMGKTWAPATTMVGRVNKDGTVTQHCMKDSVKHAIHNDLGARFSRGRKRGDMQWTPF